MYWIYLSLILIAASCTKNNQDSSQAFSNQVKVKPIVAVVPMTSTATYDLSWDVSQELSLEIIHRLTQKNEFYLVDQEKIKKMISGLSKTQDFFGANLAWLKKAFHHHEFAVFTELLEHNEAPLLFSKDQLPSESPAQLNMLVRLRIVDLRSASPQLVLEEVVEHSVTVPKQYTRSHYTPLSWQEDGYTTSFHGIVHEELVREITSRIEDYIQLAKQHP